MIPPSLVRVGVPSVIAGVLGMAGLADTHGRNDQAQTQYQSIPSLDQMPASKADIRAVEDKVIGKIDGIKDAALYALLGSGAIGSAIAGVLARRETKKGAQNQ